MYEIIRHKEKNIDSFIKSAKQLPDILNMYVQEVDSLNNCELNLDFSFIV
jgi:hypothetical protein